MDDMDGTFQLSNYYCSLAIIIIWLNSSPAVVLFVYYFWTVRKRGLLREDSAKRRPLTSQKYGARRLLRADAQSLQMQIMSMRSRLSLAVR